MNTVALPRSRSSRRRRSHHPQTTTLFVVPFDETRLGSNQQDVLKRIDAYGDVGVREAGRIVYSNRGRNPDRIEKNHLASAGWRVLLSLKQRGLVRSNRNRWVRTRQKET